MPTSSATQREQESLTERCEEENARNNDETREAWTALGPVEPGDQPGQHEHPDGTSAEESDERQDRHHQALSPARHGIREQDGHERKVEDDPAVHVRFQSKRAGRGTVWDLSQGCERPVSSRTLSMMPPVKPHRSKSLPRSQAGPR